MSERGGTEDLSSPPNGPASGSKKPITEMDRDELVAKCKGLLQIAQKAKVAKDDAANKLEKQTEKTLVLEEMVQALTEQKLSSVQANDLLRKHSEKAQLELKEALQAKDNLKTELVGKDRQIHRITGGNEDLLKQMDDLKNQLKSQVATTQDALQQISSLKDKLHHLKGENEKLNMEHEEFEDLKREHEELKEKLMVQASKPSTSIQDQEIQELNEVIYELKSSQKSSDEEIEQLKQALREEVEKSSREHSNSRLEAQENLYEYVEEITSLKLELKSLQPKQKELDERNEELQQAKEKVKKLETEQKNNAEKYKVINTALTKKHAELEEMATQLVEAKAKAGSAEKCLQEFKLMVEKSEDKIKELQHELKLNKQSSDTTETEFSALAEKKDSEVRELKTQSEQGKNRIKELEDILEHKTTELDNLKENLEKLKSEQQNVNEHHAKIEEYNEKISNLEERLGQNFNEINRLQESLNEKQHIIDDLEAAKQELSGELETKSAMLADLDGKEVYINELKAQLLSFNEAKGNEALMLASELEQNNTKIKTLESSLEVSETTISSLREEMKTLETLQTEKETLSETNEYLKWELKAKSEQTLELQQRNQHQINELRNQVEELSRTVLDKTELIKMLSEEKEKLEKDLYEVNEKEIEENHELRALQDRYQNENVIHQKAIASLQDECSNLKKELESQVKTCSESQKIIDDKNVLVAKMAQDCDEVNKNEQIIQNLNNQIASLQQIQITNNKEMESKDQYIANLKAQLEEAKGKNFSLMENLKNTLQNIKELAMEFQRFKDDAGHMIRKGQDEMAAFANKKEMEFVTLKQCLVKELSEAESRNTDLIDEMNQMNMEIKKRGEKLSIVESQCETMQQEIDAKSKELFESMKTIQDLNEKIADLNPDKTQSDAIRAISTLTNEVEALKATKVSLEGKVKAMNQKLAQEEVQSEAMSTSTISKVEEHSRMADIENSFEERYSKLKILAIKLKKKSLEQENKIKELIQNGKGGLEKEKIASLTQNYAKLQEQNDEQGDLIDEQKSTIFNLKKEVEQSTSEITELKDKLGTLEATLEATKSQKDALFIELDQVKNDLTTKEEVIKAQEMTLKDLTEKHDILSKANQQLNSNLAKFSSDDKRTDLLDMELETAERRIEELTQLSQGLEVKIQAMEQEKKREDDLKKTRDTLVEDLETSLQKETERADEFKSKLSEARACVSRLEVTLSEVRGENQCLQQRVNDFASTNEKINNQLNDLTGNAASNSQALTKRNDALQKMVNILEADIDRKKKNLTEAEDKIATLTKEYESYKIRAASVLRQSKESENQSGSKSQEVVSLERLVQSLNEKINELSKKMATSEMESQHLQEDHDRLMERHSALLQEMAAKELASRHKHEQLVILANQSEKAKQDLEIKAQNQAEALKQTFRSQIEDLQSAHSTEISKFQKQIDDLENQNILLEMAINKAKTTSNIPNQARVGSPNSQLPQVHMKTGQKLHVNLLEREAAEGSETEVLRRSSASPRNASDGRGCPTGPQSPIPLDQLLSQGDEEESSYHKGRASSITNAYVDNFESRIASAEKRVKHMTSLLSESEAENARLVQMSEVLKEEIRRYQRSEERKKHIENLEYVKNVILKFITLPGNEEKIRLVPVLTTILKLSPKEIETLQKTIQAEIEESSPQEVGWSTYLGLWSQ